MLARRWHTTPAEITGRLDEPEMQQWVERGLLFMSLESEATAKRR